MIVRRSLNIKDSVKSNTPINIWSMYNKFSNDPLQSKTTTGVSLETGKKVYIKKLSTDCCINNLPSEVYFNIVANDIENVVNVLDYFTTNDGHFIVLSSLNTHNFFNKKVKSMRYECQQYYNNKFYASKLMNMFKQIVQVGLELYTHNIFHGSFNVDNVYIDFFKDKIYITNFEKSRFVKDSDFPNFLKNIGTILHFIWFLYECEQDTCSCFEDKKCVLPNGIVQSLNIFLNHYSTCSMATFLKLSMNG